VDLELGVTTSTIHNLSQQITTVVVTVDPLALTRIAMVSQVVALVGKILELQIPLLIRLMFSLRTNHQISTHLTHLAIVVEAFNQISLGRLSMQGMRLAKVALTTVPILSKVTLEAHRIPL
jgi:hypothetical protein